MQYIEIKGSDYRPEGSHIELWKYWRELQQAAGGGLPSRSDFKPSKLIPILSSLALSEYIDDHTQLIRVIGGGHDSFWPNDAIGANLFDLIDRETTKNRQVLYHEVMTRPAGCAIDEVAITHDGRRLRYKGLFLPMLNDDGEPTIFIGSYDVETEGYDAEQTRQDGIMIRKAENIRLIDLKA